MTLNIVSNPQDIVRNFLKLDILLLYQKKNTKQRDMISSALQPNQHPMTYELIMFQSVII